MGVVFGGWWVVAGLDTAGAALRTGGSRTSGR